MRHHGYVDPLIDAVAYWCQIAIMTLSYIFNFLLIFIVYRSSRKELGKYRILIIFFTISDLYYTTLHILVYPIPEMHGNAFFMRGHGLYPELIGVGLYVGVYGQAFPILIFHFMYRLMAIKHPHLLGHFNAFFVVLVAVTAANNALLVSVFSWFFHPDEKSLRVLAPIFNGSLPQLVVHTKDTATAHSLALYWSGHTFEEPRWRNLIGLAILCIDLGISYVVIILCVYFMHKYLKERATSAKLMRIHKEFFRSLVYQSFVPLFSAYYPAAAAVMMPILGITIPYISIAVPPACATHPLIDPLLIIFTITEYRRAFFDLLRMCKTQIFKAHSSNYETSVVARLAP